MTFFLRTALYLTTIRKINMIDLPTTTAGEKCREGIVEGPFMLTMQLVIYIEVC